jgi:beta-phosphoglucomutase-like phosphatase (HAD superfamily)
MGLKPYFAAIVSSEDVTRGKPDPEVFLTAARKINRDPARCVVFEDAHVGIEAAHAGGMRVVAVTTTHRPEELARADRVVSRMDELDPMEIGTWLCGVST